MWIPFESGPAAMVALMGGQGVAYVGTQSTLRAGDLKGLRISSATARSILMPPRQLRLTGGRRVMWRIRGQKGTLLRRSSGYRTW